MDGHATPRGPIPGWNGVKIELHAPFAKDDKGGVVS